MERRRYQKRQGNFSVLVLLFVIIPLFSQAQSENSLLWKMEGESIKTSYLFGTFHILPQTEFELKDKVKNALESSEALVMELDMSNPNLQMEVMRYAPMKDSTTLDQLFDDDSYAKLDEIMESSVGMSLTQLNTLKPFIVSSLLINRFVGQQPASFESVLASLASQKNLAVRGLETPMEQMALFDEIPYQDQADDLMEMIDSESDVKKLYADMIELYKKEEVSKLYDLSVEYFDRPGALEILLLNRNEKWIPLFGDLAKEKSTFFAVGAGHLGGEKGLLNLLRKAGYKLTPIPE